LLAVACLVAGALAALALTPGCGSSEDDARASLPDAAVDAAAIDAGPALPVDLEADLEAARAASDLPALGAIALRGDVVVGIGAVGTRARGPGATSASSVPVTRDDLWQLSGAVQAMTATLAAVLVEARALRWDSTLREMLPDVPMHADYEGARLHDVLAQRAGTPTTMPASAEAALRDGDREAAVRGLLLLAPEITPGSAYHASDASFLLAALALERAAGRSWEQLVAERLFAPLGMASCKVVSEPAAPAPWGHLPPDGEAGEAGTVDVAIAPGSIDDPPAALGPAGNLRCTLGDWARFAALHLAGARAERTDLLPAEAFPLLHRPVDAIHALGWNAVPRPWSGALLALDYGSHDRGSFALVWVAPSPDVSFMVVTNQGGRLAAKASDALVGVLVDRFVAH